MIIHGKGTGIKAVDWFGFFGCSGCNSWYDDGPATKAAKEDYFFIAHSRTVMGLLKRGVVDINKPSPGGIF
jgi:hypothetical protein